MTQSKSINIIIWTLIAIVFLVAVFQATYDIGKPTIKIWDESSSARNSVEMFYNNDFLIVKSGYFADHHDSKPPLNVWAKVISYKIFGINEFAVRFPTIVAGILLMFSMLLFFQRYIKIKEIIVMLFLIMAITPGYMTNHIARTGDPDVMLTLFTTIYSLAFFILISEFPKRKNILLFFLGSGVVLAVYTKSIAGLVPLGGLVIYGLTQKNFYLLLKEYKFHLTWIISLLTIAAYYLLREKYDAGYISEGLFRELSLVNSYPKNPKSPEFSYYFNYILQHGFSILSYLILLAIPAYFISNNKKIKKLLLFSFIFSLTFILIQSSTVTKNEWYIAPVYPFLWILVSVSLYVFIDKFLKLKANKYLIIIPSFIFFITMGYFYKNFYIEIFNKNQNYKTGVYKLERDGYFLDIVKSQFKEIKDITVISKTNPRQLQFYQKKYNYGDSSNINIIHSIHKNLVGKNVITTDKDIKLLIDTNFYYTTLFTGEYGTLYKITGFKHKPCKSITFTDSINIVDNNCTDTFMVKVGDIKTTTEDALFSANSIKLTNSNPYTFKINARFQNTKSIVLSLWRTNIEETLNIIIEIPETGYYFQSSNVITDKNKGDWYQMKIEKRLPQNYNNEAIKLFLWYSGSDKILIDNIKLDIY